MISATYCIPFSLIAAVDDIYWSYRRPNNVVKFVKVYSALRILRSVVVVVVVGGGGGGEGGGEQNT